MAMGLIPCCRPISHFPYARATARSSVGADTLGLVASTCVCVRSCQLGPPGQTLARADGTPFPCATDPWGPHDRSTQSTERALHVTIRDPVAELSGDLGWGPSNSASTPPIRLCATPFPPSSINQWGKPEPVVVELRESPTAEGELVWVFDVRHSRPLRSATRFWARRWRTAPR
jgi:hypothetical protein